MADISKIQLETGTYNIKDENARNEISVIFVICHKDYNPKIKISLNLLK